MSEFRYTSTSSSNEIKLTDGVFYAVEITEGNATKLVKATVSYGAFLWPEYPGVLLTFDNNDFVIVPAYRIVSISSLKEPHLKVVK